VKVKELKQLIQESVKETLEEERKKASLKENIGYQDGSAGVDDGLQQKVEQAVTLAVHCAKTLASITPRPTGYAGSILGKCLDDIMELFVEPTGDFTVPELTPEQLRNDLFQQLDMQMVRPEGKVWKTSHAILDKVADKLDVYVAETLIAEGWGPEGDGNEHFFNVTLPEMGESVLLWAEKGHAFLKSKIEQIASLHDVEPASFVDDLERYAVKAWRKRSQTNEYIPGERLSGHHGKVLDTVQSVLDELGRQHALTESRNNQTSIAEKKG
jgi:hypothetical protein